MKLQFFSTDFHQRPQYQISQKCIEWELRWYTQTDGQTVGHDEANRCFIQIFKSAYKMDTTYTNVYNNDQLKALGMYKLRESD